MENILFIDASRFQQRGTTKYLYSLIESLDDRAFDITVCMPKAMSCAEEEIKGSFEKLGAKVVDGMAWANIVSGAGGAIKYIKFLRSLTNLGNYNFIYINASGSRFPAIALLGISRRKDIKIIVHAHNTSSRKKSRAVRMMEMICQSYIRYRADFLLACSDEAARDVFGKKALHHTKYWLTPNTIDAAKFQFDRNFREEIRNNLGISKSTFLIGSVGALVRQKNLEYMVKRLGEIQRDCDIAYLIIGAGSDLEKSCEESLRSAANASKKRIILAGSVPDVYKYLSAMDLFVMPSIFEGLGVAAVEAQACGLPCLLSSVMPQIVEVTDRVKFIPLDDTSLWREAIILNYENWKKSGNDEKQRAADNAKVKTSQFSNERLPQIAKKLFG